MKASLHLLAAFSLFGSITGAQANSHHNARPAPHAKKARHNTVHPLPPAHYEARPEVQAFAADMEKRNGFSKAELLALFAQAHFQPAVIRAILPPTSPRARSWHAYHDRFVEPRRINAGLRFWDDHAAALAQAEQQYGVPAEIIVAIIGVETIYGRNTGDFQTFSALTTLAFDYPPRADLFRRELESLLILAREEERSPLSYQGSYAGALGLPQFLPSSLRKWAVDFNGDKRLDLGQPDDAIGSVASFLAGHGWQKGAPIVAPAHVNEEQAADRIAALIAEGIEPKRLPSDLRDQGVILGRVPEQPAALIDLATPDEDTEYRLGYRNFYVLTRYNRSSFYASAVNDLAEALRVERANRNSAQQAGKA
jgi:membrane-bound lytic murein transglycosylase B